MVFTLFSTEKNYKEHMYERIQSLFLFNEVRLMEILESLQFGIGYLVVGFLAGTVLDYSFPKFEENQTSWELFRDVALQCMLLIVAVFYVRKIVKIMPFMFVLNVDINRNGRINSYRAYEASEYSGEVMIAVAILGAQFNLIKKLDLLSRRLYKFLYSEEKAIGHSLGI
jgi:hypothetical protein